MRFTILVGLVLDLFLFLGETFLEEPTNFLKKFNHSLPLSHYIKIKVNLHGGLKFCYNGLTIIFIGENL